MPILAKSPQLRWQVSRSTDPITGKSTCSVAAYDQAAGMSFSRIGLLYPFVENNPDQGVLVGVSSGGRYRVPTGDIVWRVDDKSFRTLRAQDNPAPPSAPAAAIMDVASKAMQDAVALTMRLTMAATATSTVASGDRAREMLAEMLAGQGLIFRAASAAPAYGLPSSMTMEAGQVTKDGIKPYPLDASFRDGLVACGIGSSTP